MDKFADDIFNIVVWMYYQAPILRLSYHLQTDLHNPGVMEEKRMDQGSFMRNNLEINIG